MTPILQRRLFSLLALVSILGFCSEKALAEEDASAKTSDPQRCAELTVQALDLLEKGEDDTNSKQDRLAAYTEGENLAREAVELDGSNADAHYALFANEGRKMLVEGTTVNPFNLLKVNRSLNRCLELNPDHSDALAARGGMYRQLPTLLGGSLRKAEADLKRSIELDPEATGARLELARTYHDMGDDSKAVPLARQALYWAEKLHKQRRVREAKKLLTELSANNVEAMKPLPPAAQPAPGAPAATGAPAAAEAAPAPKAETAPDAPAAAGAPSDSGNN